jgi:hypothetical protein
MPRKVGKSGFDMPDMKILLPDNLRVSIWLNEQRGTATWQLSRDSVQYRKFLESSLAPGSNDSKPETSEETPIVLTGTMNSKEDDDLPF